MKEEKGNLWNHYGERDSVICITTNGTVKGDGTAVMGKGCAKEAAERFPQFPKFLGAHLARVGNVFKVWFWPNGRPTSKNQQAKAWAICTFPVKHNWYEAADLDLIIQSAKELAKRAEIYASVTFYLPRP